MGERAAPPSSPSKSATSAPHLRPPPQAGEDRATTRKEEAPLEPGWTRVSDRFLAEKPPAELWSLFADVPQLVGCLPGAALEESDGHHLKGRMQVKLGPITATFSGSATHERDDATMTGVLAGSGGDSKSNSQARGRITYRLFPEEGGRRTRVELTLDFVLQGMLAQFSRSGLIRDFIGRMVRTFAANLARRASGIAAVETAPSAAPAAAPHTAETPSSAPEPPPMRLGSLIWSVIWARIKALFGG